MYRYFIGTIKEKESSFITLEVNNIGYKIYVKKNFSLNIEDNLKIYLYEKISELNIDFYGFESLEELSLFEKLLKVRGVGTKNAMSLLSIGTTNEILNAIEEHNVKFLAKASGISLKIADQIYIDLHNKLKQLGNINNPIIEELTSLLINLGYSNQEIACVKPLLDFSKSISELTTDAIVLIKKETDF